MCLYVKDATARGRRIAIFALDGFDSLQVSGLVASSNAIGAVPKVIGSRKGPAYPKGVQAGDEKATGVIDAEFALESANSSDFDALFIPDGDETFTEQLSNERGIHWIRETAKDYKTSELFSHFSHFHLLRRVTDPHLAPRYSVGAVGTSISVLAHKALPGDTDLKADLSEAYSSKKGFVLAQNLASDEASAWEKIKGVADLGGFGFAFFDAVAKGPHSGELALHSLCFNSALMKTLPVYALDRDVSRIKN